MSVKMFIMSIITSNFNRIFSNLILDIFLTRSIDYICESIKNIYIYKFDKFSRSNKFSLLYEMNYSHLDRSEER